MNTSIDHDHMNRVKRRCTRWSLGCFIVSVVCALLSLPPIALRVVKQISRPRPLLTAVRLMAEQNYKLSRYPTAVLIDDELAAECADPQLLSPMMVASVYTPAPTFSEFIISEERQIVCLSISERGNADSPKSETHPALMRLDKKNYVDIFGNVPTNLKMFRFGLLRFDLSPLGLQKILGADTPPDLRNFYFGIPRFFSINSTTGSSFLQQIETYYQAYAKQVFEEINRPLRWMEEGLPSMAFVAYISSLLWSVPVVLLYVKYKEDFSSRGMRTPKFRHFVLAGDVAVLADQQLEKHRHFMQERNQTLEEARRAKRNALAEERKATRRVGTNGEETPEQKQQTRRRSIEKWCAILLELTPDKPRDEMVKTENVCNQARSLCDTDYRAARYLLAGAIFARKKLNQQQNYVPPQTV